MLNFFNISCVKTCKILVITLRNSFLKNAFIFFFCHDNNWIFFTTFTNLSFVHRSSRDSGLVDILLTFFIFGYRFLALRHSSCWILTVENTFCFSFDAFGDQFFLDINIIIAFSILLFRLDNRGLLFLLVPILRLCCFQFLLCFPLRSFSVMHRPSCFLVWLRLNWKNVIFLLFVIVTCRRRFAIVCDAVVGAVGYFKELSRVLKQAFWVLSYVLGCSFLWERVAEWLSIAHPRIIFNFRTIAHLWRQPTLLILNGSLPLFLIIFNNFDVFLIRFKNSHVIFPCDFEGFVAKVSILLIFVALELGNFILKRFIIPRRIFRAQRIGFIFGDIQSNSLVFHSLAHLLFFSLQRSHHHWHWWVIF